MNSNLLTIREMARLNGVSVDTLKHCDKIGLFKPSYVNPDNLYRYYSITQTYTLMLIIDLRQLGFSLEEIARYIKDMSIAKSQKMLEEKIEDNKAKVAALQHQTVDIRKRLSQIESLKRFAHFERTYFIRSLEDREIVTQGVRVEYEIEKYAAVISLIGLVAYDSPGLSSAYFGCIVDSDERSDSELGFLTFIMRSEETVCDPRYIRTIAAGDFLCGLYRGRMEDARKEFPAMQAYLEKQGMKPAGEAIVLCLVDDYFTTDEKEMLYEIQMPFTR